MRVNLSIGVNGNAIMVTGTMVGTSTRVNRRSVVGAETIIRRSGIVRSFIRVSPDIAVNNAMGINRLARVNVNTVMGGGIAVYSGYIVNTKAVIVGSVYREKACIKVPDEGVGWSVSAYRR